MAAYPARPHSNVVGYLVQDLARVWTRIWCTPDQGLGVWGTNILFAKKENNIFESTLGRRYITVLEKYMAQSLHISL